MSSNIRVVKAICIRRHGDPDALQLDEVEPAQPGRGEALVRHTAIGVNFIDVYHRTGLYPLPSLPHGIGMEAAGVVQAVGEDVTEVKVGDRVAYASGPPGSYAEARVIDADRLVPLPPEISDEVAAAILLKGMTAEFLIRRVHPVTAGETVLFHAAVGGVGTIATQWLAHLGATVIGTVGSDEKAELAKKNGVAHAIVYTKEDFVARTRELTGGAGVPVVYDSVGKSTLLKSLDCLRPRGLFVGFGNASGKPDPLDLSVLAQKGSLFVTRPTLFTYVAAREELLASAKALFEVVVSGAVRIDLHHRWPLRDAAEAHRALAARATTGPILLLP
jgi:NADPH:quinone reductase